MRDAPSEPSAPADQAAIVLGDRHLRMLRFAVIAMGVVLVFGFVAVIARIVYLVNRGSETTSAPAAISQPLRDAARLALPAGAAIRNLSLSGSRLAVHYDGPTGSGIVILDLATGVPASRIEIVPETPR